MTSKEPTSSLAKPWQRRWAMVIGIIVGAGYISNAMALRRCERQVARWLSQDVMRGNEFTLPGDKVTQHQFKVLDSVGARYRVSADPNTVDKVPWGYVRPARAAIPYFVSVEYGWLYDGEFGEGGTRRFLCLFGLAIDLGDRSLWSS